MLVNFTADARMYHVQQRSQFVAHQQFTRRDSCSVVRSRYVGHQIARQSSLHCSILQLYPSPLLQLHRPFRETVRRWMIGWWRDVLDVVSLDELLEFGTGEASAIIRNNSLWQTVCREQSTQLFVCHLSYWWMHDFCFDPFWVSIYCYQDHHVLNWTRIVQTNP